MGFAITPIIQAVRKAPVRALQRGKTAAAEIAETGGKQVRNFAAETCEASEATVIRFNRLQKASEKLSKVFRRDVSPEECEKLLTEYKELMGTKDRDTFIQKAFEQVKKDYGYADKDIPLILKEKRNAGGYWSGLYGQVCLNPKYYKKQTLTNKQQLNIIRVFMHEFQHAKQSEYAFRADSEKYLEHICSDTDVEWIIHSIRSNEYNKKELMGFLKKDKKYSFSSDVEIESFLLNIENKLCNGNYKSDKDVMHLLDSIKTDQRSKSVELFGGLEKFEPNSENYRLGMEYLKNKENYTTLKAGCSKKYLSQFIEREARDAEYNFICAYSETLSPLEKFKLNLQTRQYERKLNHRYARTDYLHDATWKIFEKTALLIAKFMLKFSKTNKEHAKEVLSHIENGTFIPQ